MRGTPLSTFVVLFLVAAGSGVGQAQTRPRSMTHVPLTDRNERRLEHVVELVSVPERWVTLNSAESTPPWAVIRRPSFRGGIAPQTPGIYMVGMRPEFDAGEGCWKHRLAATIDLRPLRANGYRLERVERQPMTAPAGYTVEDPGFRGDPALGELQSYYLHGRHYALRLSKTRALCWTGVHARIFVRGPRGIDPVTGRRITPRREPN